MDIKLAKNKIDRYKMLAMPDDEIAILVESWGLDGKLEEALDYIHDWMPKGILIEELEEPDNEPIPDLTVPDIAWREGIISLYREIMAPTTEASDNYHFIGIMQILSILINRKAFVYHARRLYPNIYSVLVGTTGLSRKDTSMSRVRRTVYDLGLLDKPIISAIGSAEGLLDWFNGENQSHLLVEGEYKALMAKAKQNGTGNLIPIVTELWDTPDRYEPKTRSNKDISCVNPFLSIMVGTTPEWLAESLMENDIYGGYANRWVYIMGKHKTEPMPNPPQVDPDLYNTLIEALKEIHSWVNELDNEGEIKLTNDAESLYNSWYIDNYQELEADGIIPKLLVRVDDNAFKIALLMACADKSRVIKEEHMSASIEVAKFLKSSIKELFKSYNKSPDRRDEDRLLNMLKFHGKLSHRDLYRLMNISGKRLNELTNPLLKMGLIREGRARNPKNYKTTNYYEVV